MRIVRVARRRRCFNCWRAPTRPEPTSALSATPSMLARANSECAASRAFSNWSSGMAAWLARTPARRRWNCVFPSIASCAVISGAQSTGSSHSATGRSTHTRTQPISRPDPTTHQLRGTPSMNVIELNRCLVQLRLSGMAAVLETRLLQAQSENMAPIGLISTLVSDELACRSKRLLERRHKQAQFRDAGKRLDNFDFQFNPKMNRSLIFELAAANWVGKREDALFLGPPGSGKSHCAQAIGHAVIQQGYRVLYREAHRLLEELADAALDGKRKEFMGLLTTVPLLIIDDLGMRKLPLTAAEELLEIIKRRYERASTLLTSNRPVDDWGKLLGDSAAVTAMLDRLLHHGHVLKCGPRSWRTRTGSTGDAQ